MEDTPEKSGYAMLRRFRESKPGRNYFLTANLAGRGRGLEAGALTETIRREWRELEADGSWLVRTSVVMPDHVHLLVALSERRPLEECMRLFKGRLSRDLRRRDLRWQEGFYERGMRGAEDVAPVFHYVYLNPYRAKLVSENQTWPGYYCWAEDWKWFGAMTDESVPQPEWLR